MPPFYGKFEGDNAIKMLRAIGQNVPPLMNKYIVQAELWFREGRTEDKIRELFKEQYSLGTDDISKILQLSDPEKGGKNWPADIPRKR